MQSIQLPHDSTYWGKPTAPIDWCEENYVVGYSSMAEDSATLTTTTTPVEKENSFSFFFSNPYYVAEFHNTWTNSAYTVAGLYVLWHYHFSSTVRQKSRRDPSSPSSSSLSPSVWSLLHFSGLSMVILSIFSGLFHASLLYHYQKLDEIFENLILLFQNYAVEQIIATLFNYQKSQNSARSGSSGGNKSSSSSSSKAMIREVNKHLQRTPDSFIEPVNKPMLIIHTIALSAMIWYVPALPTAEVHLIGSCLLILWRLNQNILSEKMSTHLHLTILFFLIGGLGWIIDFTMCSPMIHVLGGFNPQLHAYLWHVFTALSLWQGHLAIVEFLEQSSRVVVGKKE